MVLALSTGAAKAQDFRFNTVQVEGNQRIETATILSYLGFEPGESVSAAQLNAGYQNILDSGVFEEVELDPRGSTLVIRVEEFPTINAISFEGNRRLDDDQLTTIVQSAPRRVFSNEQARADANEIASAYAQQGRIAARVTPKIIRRSDNRVDLVFEITEGQTVEVERISFVGNRAFSDRRLRGALETKQASILRTFVRSDTLIEDRLEFDKQLLRDFYQARGYVDFEIVSTNTELTEERDGFFVTFNVREGQQFRLGEVSTVSEMPNADADAFQDALKIKPGMVYSPTLIENSIARQERLAVREGIDFLRVEPRVTRNDRDLTLDVEFVLTRGPRVFVERIDIEGNTTTLDRVIRQQFRIVEGDPFNPREIRQSAERIRALGFFANSSVDAREGSAPDRVIIDVDVEEQPTGSLNLGGSFSTNDGFGVAIGLTEENFLGRGQRLSARIATAEDATAYTFGFEEPYLLGRDLRFGIDLGYIEEESSFSEYDTDELFFRPALTFPVSEAGRLSLRYTFDDITMDERSSRRQGAVINNEIALGARSTSALGLAYNYDSRRIGLNPDTGYRFEVSADLAGLGGDNKFIETRATAQAQTRILNDDVVLRAAFEGGAISWQGNSVGRTVDRFLLNSRTFRGFEPGGIGPRDLSAQVNGDGANADDALGGNFFAVARFEAQFPLGLPEEVGMRGAAFYDIGNLWNLSGADLTDGDVVGESGSFRQVIGVALLWNTPIGPLRFNFTQALSKEEFDKEQQFDLTLSAQF
ncbi:MAG: outer membrane protein assembly factor BamA [Marinibacterium sp.]|nr:outer membrane protein assembly factor BamA [Marinibacterium sp.]